jgi:hypothetical protein
MAQTDSQGQFSIVQAPVGSVKLFVDGSTAQAPGNYPSLDYDIVTIPGQSNDVGQPIYLLPLTNDNQLCVTATTGGGTLTVPDAPGFSLTFGPGQATFPGGSKVGCVTVTVVHSDKVPMMPGFGQQPRFIVTIQPAGAIFNPPAPITLPNVDGLKPRAVTEMYSFDHDIGSFVAIGTGTVSEDGLLIRSNVGVGVLKAGWHCGGDPNDTGNCCSCADCETCDDSGSCIAATGGECDDEDKCTEDDTCSNGSCEGTPIPLKPDLTFSPFTFNVSPGPIAKLNDNVLSVLTKFGVKAEVNFFQFTSTVALKECCEPTLGKGYTTTGSFTGKYADFTVKFKAWPPGPIIKFGPKLIPLGFASLEFEAEFLCCVFLNINGNMSGEVGYRQTTCSDDPVEQTGCGYADFGFKLTPSVSAEASGSAQVTVNCIGCGEPVTLKVGAAMVVGELSWPLDIGNLTYNVNSCSEGVGGANFKPNPGAFKVYAKFSGTYQTLSSGALTIEKTLDFATCKIVPFSVTCL